MENILKVFLMAFPEWLACIFMVVGLVVTALAAVRLGYGLVVAKTVYKWIVNAEEKFGSGAGAEKKAHVIAVLRGYTPDWLDWAINERTLDRAACVRLYQEEARRLHGKEIRRNHYCGPFR